MKKSFRSQLLLAAVLLVAVGQTSRAQSWQLVDDYTPDFGIHKAGGGGVIAAGGPSNLVFAACIVSTTNDLGGADHPVGVVRRSTNQGATWETVDISDSWWTISALAVSPTGPVVAVGSSRTSWLVRMSLDGGTTWNTVDEYSLSAYGSSAYHVEVASDGTIYVHGGATDNFGGRHGTVRRSSDNGASWETVEVDPGGGVYAMKLTQSGMFMTCMRSDSVTGDNFWHVARSTDQLATWTTVDDWRFPGDTACPAEAMAEDSAGNLVVIGRRLIGGGGGFQSLARRSADGGDTWVTTDVLADASIANAVVADHAGRFFALYWWGWLRISNDTGLTWSDSPSPWDIPGGWDPQVAITGMTVDSAGNLYAVGAWPRLAVSKLAARGPELFLQRSGNSLSVRWSASAIGYVLQSATTLANGGDWQDSNLTSTEINGQKVVTVTPTAPRAFFRLRGP